MRTLSRTDKLILFGALIGRYGKGGTSVPDEVMVILRKMYKEGATDEEIDKGLSLMVDEVRKSEPDFDLSVFYDEGNEAYDAATNR